MCPSRYLSCSQFLGLTLPTIYYDRIHPSDLGHTILAHSLVHLFKRTRLFYHTMPQACARDGSGVNIGQFFLPHGSIVVNGVW